MLGEKLGSIQGGTTNKTLPVEDSLPKFETTTEGSGTLAGVDVTSMATYSSEMRADGTLYGECPNPRCYYDSRWNSYVQSLWNWNVHR